MIGKLLTATSLGIAWWSWRITPEVPWYTKLARGAFELMDRFAALDMSVQAAIAGSTAVTVFMFRKPLRRMAFIITWPLMVIASILSPIVHGLAYPVGLLFVEPLSFITRGKSANVIGRLNAAWKTDLWGDSHIWAWKTHRWLFLPKLADQKAAEKELKLTDLSKEFGTKAVEFGVQALEAKVEERDLLVQALEAEAEERDRLRRDMEGQLQEAKLAVQALEAKVATAEAGWRKANEERDALSLKLGQVVHELIAPKEVTRNPDPLDGATPITGDVDVVWSDGSITKVKFSNSGHLTQG